MSRRPKPTAVKMLEGNPGGRPLNADEPTPALGVPEKPRGMSSGASRIWDRFVRELSEMKVLSVVDGVALREACVSAALAERYSLIVMREPMVKEPYFSKDGGLLGYRDKVNPATAGYIACSKNMKQFLIEYGLTPASRSKLRIERPKSNPEEEGLLSRSAQPQAADEPDLDEIDETTIQ